MPPDVALPPVFVPLSAMMLFVVLDDEQPAAHNKMKIVQSLFPVGICHHIKCKCWARERLPGTRGRHGGGVRLHCVQFV